MSAENVEKQCFLGATRDPGRARSPAVVLSEPLVPLLASAQIPSFPIETEKKQVLLGGGKSERKGNVPRLEMPLQVQDRPTNENR